MRDPRYVEGVRMFNDRLWFECHEELEMVWRDDPSPGRIYWQGLIMGAVALEHWRRGNLRGARSQWRQGRAKLDPFRPVHEGLDVERFVTEMDALLAPIMDFQDPGKLDEDKAPKWWWVAEARDVA